MYKRSIEDYYSHITHTLFLTLLVLLTFILLSPKLAYAQNTPTCFGEPATIVGTNSSDTIMGTEGNDVISSLGGNDTVFGNGGDDKICLGNGMDTAFGGPGNDSIDGEAGNDTINGNDGDDILLGGKGTDTLYGSLGNDTLDGVTGIDNCINGETNLNCSEESSDNVAPIVSITSPADPVLYIKNPIIIFTYSDDNLGLDLGTLEILLNDQSIKSDCDITATLATCTTSNLALGNYTVDAKISDIVGNEGTATLDFVVDAFSPEITITEPDNFIIVNSTPITVAGTVNFTDTLEIGGLVIPISSGAFSSDIPLNEGLNNITIVGKNTDNKVTTVNLQITLDTTPPVINITSPADGSTVNSPIINVAGTITDVGGMLAPAATVDVNGVVADVINGTFLAENVSLTPGANTITASGTDDIGNAGQTSINVTFEDLTGQPNISLFSGNNQAGVIGTLLTDPLVVVVRNAAGTPVANAPVEFKVTSDQGYLEQSTNEGRTLTVLTDAQGNASVDWTLGTRAGSSTNMVEATANGFLGTVVFNAIVQSDLADKISLDAGNDQTGMPGQPLPLPFVATVTDLGNNRIEGVEVTFTILEGGGNFEGQNSVTVTTDNMGEAMAVLTLGLQEGIRNNIVEADFSGNTGFAAGFHASAILPGDPLLTSVKGVVLDNTNIPIEGVTIHIDGTTITTLTDSEGQFFLQPAPIGHIYLEVEGATANRPGVWPHLEFELMTVSGYENSLPMPVFLLPIDVARGINVDATTGGTLTLPELPGFSMEIEPGSAVFPDGSDTGNVSVTLVHADKIPMTPNFGQQPRFVITIQPPGVHFDPPAKISFPNVDGLAPGQITEFYSFDHDLGRFITIGTGSVSDDGTLIVADPGVGIIEGGWHCGGDPTTTGTAATCPKCLRCVENRCVEDPGQNGEKCRNCRACANGACAPNLAVNDLKQECPECEVCKNGSCAPKQCNTEDCLVCESDECVQAPELGFCKACRFCRGGECVENFDANGEKEDCPDCKRCLDGECVERTDCPACNKCEVDGIEEKCVADSGKNQQKDKCEECEECKDGNCAPKECPECFECLLGNSDECTVDVNNPPCDDEMFCTSYNQKPETEDRCNNGVCEGKEVIELIKHRTNVNLSDLYKLIGFTHHPPLANTWYRRFLNSNVDLPLCSLDRPKIDVGVFAEVGEDCCEDIDSMVEFTRYGGSATANVSVECEGSIPLWFTAGGLRGGWFLRGEINGGVQGSGKFEGCGDDCSLVLDLGVFGQGEGGGFVTDITGKIFRAELFVSGPVNINARLMPSPSCFSAEGKACIGPLNGNIKVILAGFWSQGYVIGKLMDQVCQER